MFPKHISPYYLLKWGKYLFYTYITICYFVCRLNTQSYSFKTVIVRQILSIFIFLISISLKETSLPLPLLNIIYDLSIHFESASVLHRGLCLGVGWAEAPWFVRDAWRFHSRTSVENQIPLALSDTLWSLIWFGERLPGNKTSLSPEWNSHLFRGPVKLN